MLESKPLAKLSLISWNLSETTVPSVALAFQRRRGRAHRLLVHIRRFAALCLSRDIFATVRWIPCEFNLDHRSVALSTMQVNQCRPGWRKHARAMLNIAPLHTAVRIR